MKRWVLNLEDGGLSSGGDLSGLSPKSTDVLACLINNAGSVLSRNDILQAAWPGLHVSPDLVRENIFEIRKALGDDASEPKYIETVGRRGFRLIGPVSIQSQSRTTGNSVSEQLTKSCQQSGQMPVVKFARSKDGTSIAHTISGDGTPLLIAGSWMSHLDMDWENPVYSGYLKHLSRKFQVIRYDQRGNGLSQWSDVDISFERMVDDMAAIVDEYGHEKLAILGMSQGASVAIAYALRQPDRVSHLVLNGGYARGRKHRGNDADREESDALVSLIRHSWGNENPAIRQTLTTLFMPEASKEQMQWFNDFQKICGPAENIAQFRAMFDDMNVAKLLPEITTPTLVLHSDRDAVAPLSEGKLLACQIEGSSFVQLNSPNHMLFETEQDFTKMIDNIDNFINSGLSA
ncbi:alpha/beta fold hydrolase [Roseovarius aestuarii]|uniref:Arylesterase n=1 Tax=Roseovarius aestuarii TaxID=475083 RepID=A0A1X7BXY4_9RHOB|nr:alpha/beta fold hydrolase [Roseovarius aestuarii]SMC14443.1 Arylesterase [Roseovarius aestuarii]